MGGHEVTNGLRQFMGCSTKGVKTNTSPIWEEMRVPTVYDSLQDVQATLALVTMRWQPTWPINSHQGSVPGRWVPGWKL